MHEYDFVSAEDLAVGRRDQNILRYWTDLHELGFRVVTDGGAIVASSLDALSLASIHLLAPEQPIFSPPSRVGFFTHSLVGNAIILLTVPPSCMLPNVAVGKISGADISFHPNRHYLQNGRPVDVGRLVFVRHVQTEANERGVALGRSNGRGGWRGEITDLTPRVAPANVAKWYCSSLNRTIATAAVFGVARPAVCSKLDEMDIGFAEGQPEEAVLEGLESAKLMFAAGDPFAAIVDEDCLESPVPPGECFVAVLLRVASCLNELFEPDTP